MKKKEMHSNWGKNDTLTIEVHKDNQTLLKKEIEVSGITGKVNNGLKGMSGKSIITDDICISYGLYDSYHSPISDKHRLHCVVTENQSQWMSKLFNDLPKSVYEKLKLSDLILPGSHDAGMYTDQPLDLLASFANTQKDDVNTQLNLGARIFDFRPGTLVDGWGVKFYESKLAWYWRIILGGLGILGGAQLENLYSNKKNTVRHIHAFIPGETYENFLNQIIQFLKKNEDEIVVINTASNGIEDDAVQLADKSTLDIIVSKALEYYPSLKIGDKTSLTKKIEDLKKSNERLIIIGENEKIVGKNNAMESIGSYSSKMMESYISQNVIDAFNTLNNKDWTKKEVDGKITHVKRDLVEFSCQLTATAASDVVIMGAVSNGGTSASPILATKAATDIMSYEWIKNGTLKTDNQEALVAFYNDYFDPGLTAVIAKTLRDRLKNK